ncbi:heavy-metal-associated domain-containing protein [Lentisalinibacter sediminis]|uniref:heavy-metal-associated domain-containing protein n=1 Tax=Lentisalinibacter sediminis TaxID=2992237 RepID=UPI00386FA7FD
MIASTVPGRIRIRSGRLKSRKIATAVREAATALDGVNSARVNTAAGSLVVTYDAAENDGEALEKKLEDVCLTAGRDALPVRRDLQAQLNRVTKVGMIATLGTSLAYGYAGKKKPHIAFGSAFLVFAGLHMLRYRARLLR